jgi:hypothetical protein
LWQEYTREKALYLFEKRSACQSVLKSAQADKGLKREEAEVTVSQILASGQALA